MALPWRIARDVLDPGVPHRYGPHRQHRAELKLPRGDGPFPVVVLVHGGYWRARYGKAVMRPLACDLARRGFATWNIEYRRIGRGQGGGWPATFDDVGNAIDHLAQIDDPRLDLDDVTLIGHSAGGHLALWATSREDSAVTFRRVIAQAPVVNLTVTPAARDLMGGSPEQVPDRYALGNPMQLLPLGLPMLLVHTPDDATIPVVRTREFAEAARAAGDEVGLVEPYPGGHRSHIDPRTKAWEAAVEWLTEAHGERIALAT